MKKLLLVLLALMGIGFGAKAQSCKVADDGTYVAVNAYVGDSNLIHCEATCYGSKIPSSGTVYVTVYFINNEGNEDSEMITINWNKHNDGGDLGLNSSWRWRGKEKAKRILRWEVSAGACYFK